MHTDKMFKNLQISKYNTQILSLLTSAFVVAKPHVAPSLEIRQFL